MTRWVSKSLINGAFRPISSLTRNARKQVGGYKAARGVTAGHQAIRDSPKVGVYVKHAHANPGYGEQTADLAGLGGFTLRHGGKNTGKSHIFIATGHSPKVRASLLEHEQQHARPRRSQYRMASMVDSPSQLGREEARADFFSSGHYSTAAKVGRSSYAGAAQRNEGGAFNRAYKKHQDMLQSKIHKGVLMLEMVAKSDLVQKNSPDSADVHLLRPLKRVRKPVSKAAGVLKPVDPDAVARKKERRIALGGLAATGVAAAGGAHAIHETLKLDGVKALKNPIAAWKAAPRAGKIGMAAGAGWLGLHGVELAADSMNARAQVRSYRANRG